MIRVYTHPDNKKECEDGYRKNLADKMMREFLLPFPPEMMPLPFEIIPCQYMDRLTESKEQFVLPDGRTVGKAEIYIENRFYSYTPEDWKYLLWKGTIKPAMVPYLVWVDDKSFDFGLNEIKIENPVREYPYRPYEPHMRPHPGIKIDFS